MKKVVLCIALAGLFVAGNSSFGQEVEPDRNPERKSELTIEEKADIRTERLVKDLELNEAQAAQLKSLHMEQVQKMEENRKKMHALKAEMKADREAHEAQLNSILTPEQIERHEALKAERKAHHTEKKKHANCKE